MTDKVQNNGTNTFKYEGTYKEPRNFFNLANEDGEIKINFKRPGSKKEETFIKTIEYGTNIKGSTEYKTIDVLNELQKYSTEDSPEITQEELWQITDATYKSNETVLEKVYKDGGSRSYSKTTPSGTVINNLERASEHYSDPNSPDGENINVDEIYDMAELLLTWGGFKKEEKE